jgi:serine/threonine protein kinase
MAAYSLGWDHYWEDLGPLGTGYQGKTRKVRSKEDSNKIGVIKFLREPDSMHARRRFHQEATNVGLLMNARVKAPDLYESATEHYQDPTRHLYFVMEFIPGPTVRKEISSRGPQSLDHAIRLSLDLCRAIAGSHAESIYHRDLKPANIIARDFANAYLVVVDYGLSYSEKVRATGDDISYTQENIGNKFLVLPEGEDRRDPKRDVAAVCGLFFYFLSGKDPGRVVDAGGRLPHRRDLGAFIPSSATPHQAHQVAVLLDRGLALDVQSRFETIDELADRLAAIANTPRGKSRSPSDVAAELSEVLVRTNRKSQLAHFGAQTKTTVNLIQQCFNQNRGTFGQFSCTIGGTFHSVGWPKDVDLVTDLPPFTIEVLSQSPCASLLFRIGSRGNECVLLRNVVLDVRGGNSALKADCQQLIWFGPSDLPTTEQITEYVAEGVSLAMTVAYNACTA